VQYSITWQFSDNITITTRPPRTFLVKKNKNVLPAEILLPIGGSLSVGSGSQETEMDSTTTHSGKAPTWQTSPPMVRKVGT